MINADVLDVVLRISNLRRFTAGMAEAAGSVKSVGAAAKATNAETAMMGRRTGAVMALGRAAKWGALGLAAMAAEAYKLNVDFGATMTRVATMAGASNKEVADLRGQVIGLSRDSAFGPGELAKGLYHLESIGLRGADAMYALRAASDAAAVGGADLEDTTTALGATLRVHMKGAADDARGAVAQLAAIAGAGNMTMQNLVHALGTGILPAAKAAGLSLTSVGSAIALLTDEGYPASSGAAQLGTALHFLYAPTNKAKDALFDLGLSQADLVATMNGPQGLMGALGLLEDRLQAFSGGDRAKYLEELGNILPGGRGRVLILLMNQLENYRKKQEQIKRTSGDFEEHLGKTQTTAQYRIHNAWSNIQADLIEFADEFQGPMTDAIGFFLLYGIKPLIDGLTAIPDAVKDVIHWIKHLPWPLKLALEALGLLVGEIILYQAVVAGVAIVNGLAAASYAVLAGAAETAAIAMLIALDNPILLGIAALITILVLVITHWKQVKQAAIDTWHWIKQAAMDAYHWISKHLYVLAGMPIIGWLAILVIWVVRHWNDIKHFISGVAHGVSHVWHTVIGKIKGFFHSLYEKALWVFKKIKNAALRYTPLGLFNRFFGTHTDDAVGINHGPPNGHGTNFGFHVVPTPSGAGVVTTPPPNSFGFPRHHTPNPSGGASAKLPDIHHTTVVQIDRKEVGRAVNRFNADRRARRDG